MAQLVLVCADNQVGAMSRVPQVSVAIASYNHAPYVAASLHSVLDQSFQDFEIVITDDGSQDATVDAARQVPDPRISMAALPRNVGACIALNASIRRSSGRYVAILNSDDVFLPGKLERQVKFLDANPEIGAVFGYPEFIDERGNRLAGADTFYGDTFRVRNRTRAEWLRHFFFDGNVLCHPSVLIRRECYDTVGLYNPALAQIPDLEMWIRLLHRFKIYLLEEPVVGFRILPSGQNASAGRPDAIARLQWEWLRVLPHYADLNTDLFAEVFPELRERLSQSGLPATWLLGQFACATRKPPHILFGLDLMHQAAARVDAPDLYREFIRYSGAYDIFDVLSKAPNVG